MIKKPPHATVFLSSVCGAQIHKKDEAPVTSLKLTLIILYYENNMNSLNTCVWVGAILWKILKNMQYAQTF
jgi:hypothetical protein